MSRKRYFSVALMLAVGAAVATAGNALCAQEANSESATTMYQGKRIPIYRVTVVSRTIKAINYRHRSAETKVEFRGTSVLPEATGSADVQSKTGTIKVDSRFKNLPPANRFGPEYLTYVLWAISPEGRAVNLGEVLPNDGGNAKLQVTSDLQSFGMIVTAEPYFAVTRPSDVVVMENFVTNETNGTVQDVEAKYELLKRGQYIMNANAKELMPMETDSKTPIDIYEARNAVRLARWMGAGEYAADTMKKADLDLQNAESMLGNKSNRKEAITNAREAVQMAEDAREITMRKMLAEERAHEQQTTADAQATAQAESAAAAEARRQAERAQADAERAQQEKAQADAAKLAAEAQAAQSQQAAQQAQLQAQQQVSQAEAEKAALRAKLLEQLNSVLQTRDSARGLIVNISDVLFDTGKYTLKSGAREKLAKVAGILLAHQGLIMEVDGYTDSVGGDAFNQRLSEQRASAVRDYLASQGVPDASITAKGFGKTNPVASNDTAQGRQQNRRVELVVAGDLIKAQLKADPTSNSSQ